MRKAYEGLIVILETYSAVLMLVMLGVVLVGVFYRYVVDEALSWYDEFAGYILVWLTMYGSVVGLAKGKHISFETLVEKLPREGTGGGGLRHPLRPGLLPRHAGVRLGARQGDGGETAVSVPGVKMAWIYSVMPISGALMVLVGMVQLIMLFTGGDGPGGARPKAMEEGQ